MEPGHIWYCYFLGSYSSLFFRKTAISEIGIFFKELVVLREKFIRRDRKNWSRNLNRLWTESHWFYSLSDFSMPCQIGNTCSLRFESTKTKFIPRHSKAHTFFAENIMEPMLYISLRTRSNHAWLFCESEYSSISAGVLFVPFLKDLT